MMIILQDADMGAKMEAGTAGLYHIVLIKSTTLYEQIRYTSAMPILCDSCVL